MGGFFPQAGAIKANIDKLEREAEARRQREAGIGVGGDGLAQAAARMATYGVPGGRENIEAGLRFGDAFMGTTNDAIGGAVKGVGGFLGRGLEQELGLAAPEPKAADYAKNAGAALPVAAATASGAAPENSEAARIVAARKAQADADALKALQDEKAASLEGVTTDLPGGGWSQTRVDAHRSLPSVLKRLTLEQAAAEGNQWENDGSLGQVLGDAGARELLDTKYAMENERIDKEAAANDPQKRDLEARRLDAAADEYVAKDRGQRLPTLGGVYDTKRPKDWTPGLFEAETDAAGRETFVNAQPQPAHDPKMKAAATLMQGFDAAIKESNQLQPEQREAYLEQALIRMGFQGEMMGLGKDLLRQVAALIEARGSRDLSLAEAAEKRALAAG